MKGKINTSVHFIFAQSLDQTHNDCLLFRVTRGRSEKRLQFCRVVTFIKDTWRNTPRDKGVFYIFPTTNYLEMSVFQDLPLVSYCLRNIVGNKNFCAKIWIVLELCATCMGLDDCSPFRLFCLFFIVVRWALMISMFLSRCM